MQHIRATERGDAYVKDIAVKEQHEHRLDRATMLV
jgi:hypothetical protein